MKVLVLGRNGQLGRCLEDQLITTAHQTFFTSRPELDITDLRATRDKISRVKPDVVINPAAYTSVDAAEAEPEEADLVNHLAVANIAQICADVGSVLIHFSTDYVFDGEANVPYKEGTRTNPLGVYGKTKLLGELAIQQSGCKYLVIRTAWMFSEYGNNFVKTMLWLGTEKDELSVVGDQVGCPTYAQDIAKAIVHMLAYLDDEKTFGVYHFCGDGQCSWYQFAYETFQEAKQFDLGTPNHLHSISSTEYPTPAKRPNYSVLDCNKSLKVFGILPSDWKAGISNVLSLLKAG
jgi:dTDP-4-dehydrorhamnose reductase